RDPYPAHGHGAGDADRAAVDDAADAHPAAPRPGAADRRAGLSADPDRSVELESAEFCNAYRLFVADEESELVVRRVFTPALIVQLVELAGARMTIEFETGALVCSVHGR